MSKSYITRTISVHRSPEQSIKACHTDGITQYLLLNAPFICTCSFSISIRLLKRGRQLEGQCNSSSQALPICSAVLKHHILQFYPSLHFEKMCLDMHNIKDSVGLTKLYYYHYLLGLFSIFFHLGKHLVCKYLVLLSEISVFTKRTNSKRNIFV